MERYFLKLKLKVAVTGSKNIAIFYLQRTRLPEKKSGVFFLFGGNHSNLIENNLLLTLPVQNVFPSYNKLNAPRWIERFSF